MKKNFFLDLELSLADAVLLGTNVRILSKRLDSCTEDLQKGGKDSWSVLESAFQNEFHNKRVLRLVASKVVLTDNQRLRMMVCLGKKWDEIKPLLPDDVDFQNNESGSTLLMDAARFGQVNVARHLIEAGADVNARDFDGWTALRYGEDDWKIVRLLVENGADINTKDNDGDMFLDSLWNNEHPIRFIRFALKNGANEETKNRMWDCLIQKMRSSENSVPIKAIELLLNAGVNINRLSNDIYPRAALHEAVKFCNDIAVITYLIKRGADANLVDGTGCTPLDGWRYEARSSKIAEILIRAGANISNAFP